MSVNGIVEIGYKTPLHAKLIEEIRRRLKAGQDVLAKRNTQWKENEDVFMAYMTPQEEDKLDKAKRDKGKKTFTEVTIPYSYATLLSAHTYYSSVFLARSPVFQVSGRHGEGQNSEMAIEAILDYQLGVGGNLVPLYTWLLDPGRYGIGWLGHKWDKEVVTTLKYVQKPRTVMGIPVGGTETTEVEEETVGYEGARLFNIRPQDMITDPSYPASQFQSGEFCARYVELSMHEIRKKERLGVYYNVADALVMNDRKGAHDRGSSAVLLPNDTREGSEFSYKDKRTTYLCAHEFHWEINPSDWGLAKRNRYEKWVFTVANENVIISAQPLNLYSNKYPFDVLEHEIDAYAVYKRGLLEVMDPLNKTMEWLFNSHFYNVRASLNNQFVVDPSRIEMKDFENPNPGKFIRLKPLAFGTNPLEHVGQLPVSDVTRANISDTGVVAEILQRVTGINDTVMGMQQGGRKTATEVRSSTTFGINRMKTNCEYFSAMGFAPLTQKLIQLTQQMYTSEQKFRLVGNLGQWADRYINVSGADIAGFYDFIPVDGTLPVDRFAQANLWKELLGNMNVMPQVAMTYDLPKIFSFVAQLAGLKNIDQFRVVVAPDAEVLNAAATGGMVPAGRENLNEPGQIPGMGPTG